MPKSFLQNKKFDRQEIASRLRKSAASKSLDDGQQLHSAIAAAGLDRETFLGNLLVQMYSKCDRSQDAHLAFDRIIHKNIFSWNAILVAYSQAGRLQLARNLLGRMPQLDVYSWTIVLTSHTDRGELNAAESIFDQMPERNAVAWTALFTAYASQGHLLQAEAAFNSMPDRDAASWNAMIAAHSRNGDPDGAQDLFDLMPQRDLISWNTITTAFVENRLPERAKEIAEAAPEADAVSCNCILQAHIESGDARGSKTFFDTMRMRSVISWNLMIQADAFDSSDIDEAIRRIPALDLYTHSLLIASYFASGRVDDARRVFDSMISHRDAVIWTSMILGYAQEEQHHQLQRARNLLDQMPCWNAVSGTILAVAYAQRGDLDEAVRIFDRIPERDACAWNAMITVLTQKGELMGARHLFTQMPSRDIGSWNAILQSHAVNGEVNDVQFIFSRMVKRDLVSWNTALAAYAARGGSAAALKLFAEMDLEGVKAVPISFASLLNACRSLQQARLIHAEIVDNEIAMDVFVWTSLVNLYGRCGCLDQAAEIFQTTSGRDLASWNAMIAAYARNSHPKEALLLFKMMDLEGVTADDRSFAIVLDVCAGLANLADGRLIHQSLVQSRRSSHGLKNRRPILDTALLNLYGSCGELATADKIFQRIANKDAAAWNSMITQSKTNGDADRALQLFRRMDLEGCSPDEVTFRRVVEICGEENSNSVVLQQSDVAEMRSDLFLATALLNMYGKCGKLEEALKIFANISVVEDTACWNALLGAFSHNGHCHRVLNLFASMQLQGMDPDSTTFVILLSACSHCGKLEEGFSCFASITESFGLIPSVNHFVCMADLLARLGQVENAERLVRCMPFEPLPAAWTSVLGACHSHGNVDRASNAAVEALDVEPGNSSLYVLLSNALSSASALAPSVTNR